MRDDRRELRRSQYQRGDDIDESNDRYNIDNIDNFLIATMKISEPRRAWFQERK